MFDDMTRFSSYEEDIEQAQFWAEVQAEQELQCKVKDGEKW